LASATAAAIIPIAMDDLPRPATWVSDAPPRSQTGRGIAAVAAIVIGVAALAAAGVLLVRQIADDRSQPPGLTLAPPITETTTVAIPPPALVDGEPSVVSLEDETGRLSVSVPEEWGDVATSVWIWDGEEVGVWISAATDRIAWFEGWGTPGAFIGVTHDASAGDLFGNFDDVCTYRSRDRIMAGTLAGEVDLWAECGAERGTFAVVVAAAEDGSFVMLIHVVVTDDDWRGFFAILESVAYRP
jgi:hypothetical protein